MHHYDGYDDIEAEKIHSELDNITQRMFERWAKLKEAVKGE